MITIHHLGVSQSDRIVWLIEELHLPYRLKWHKRTESGLALDAYLALHPAATAPVIEDEGTVLTELNAHWKTPPRTCSPQILLNSVDPPESWNLQTARPHAQT